MMRRFTTLFLLFLICFTAKTYAYKLENYIIKFIYINNFVDFTTFPNGTYKNIVNLCILGENSLALAIDKVKHSKNNNDKLFVKVIPSIQNIEGCNFLFISFSERYILPQILDKIANKPILTISEIEDFADKGGIIEFVDTKEGEVKFIINKKVADKANIKFDPLLFEIAIKIIQ